MKERTLTRCKRRSLGEALTIKLIRCYPETKVGHTGLIILGGDTYTPERQLLWRALRPLDTLISVVPLLSSGIYTDYVHHPEAIEYLENLRPSEGQPTQLVRARAARCILSPYHEL